MPRRTPISESVLHLLRHTLPAIALLTASSALAQQPGEDKEPAPATETDEATSPDTPPSHPSRGAELKEIVVTATRTPHTAFETPLTTDTVTAERMQEKLSRSAAEALRGIPGVMVQKTSNGQGSPYIRGFTGFRTLLLVDGIRLNNSVFRSGPNQYWNTVDPLSLDRIEVIKGPSSMLYGSDAIGGVVAGFTRSPTISGPGVNAGGRIVYRYSLAENSNVGRAELNFGAGDSFGVLMGFSLKDFDDVRAGGPTGNQPNTGYGEGDVDLKSELRISDDARLVFAYQRVRQNNVPRTHKTIFAKSFRGTTIGKERRRDIDQERELFYTQLIVDNMEGFIDSMRLSLSFQRQQETRDRIKKSGKRDLQGFDVGTFGASAQLQSSTPLGNLTYGAEFYHDNVGSFSTKNKIQGPVADDATYNLVGIYIQDEKDLSDRLSVVFGGRFSYASVNAGSVQDPTTGQRVSLADNWSALVGSGRFLYRLVPDRVNLFAGVSRGFRAPNLSDLTRLDSNRSNEIETPAPGLTPEFFVSYEAGVKTQGPRWNATATYFYTSIRDSIIRTPTGRVIDGENEVTKLNAGDGFVQGVEFGAAVNPHQDWTVFGNLAWVDGEVDTFPTSDRSAKVREPLSRLMPITGQIGLRYDEPKNRYWAEGVSRMAARADKLSTRDRADTSRIPPGGTPGYAVVTVRGGWRLRDNVNLTLAVENIFDEDYRVHGSGQNEPGRNLVIGVEIKF